MGHYTEVESDLWVNERPDTDPLVRMGLSQYPLVGELRLPVALEGSDVLVVVKHGLALERYILRGQGVGAEFILHCDLPTDLSGLALRQSSELGSLKADLDALLQTVQFRISTQLERLEFAPISALRQTGETAQALLGVALSVGEVGFFAAPLIVVGSLGFYARNVVNRWNLGDLKEHLRRETGARLQTPSEGDTAPPPQLSL